MSVDNRSSHKQKVDSVLEFHKKHFYENKSVGIVTKRRKPDPTTLCIYQIESGIEGPKIFTFLLLVIIWVSVVRSIKSISSRRAELSEH